MRIGLIAAGVLAATFAATPAEAQIGGNAFNVTTAILGTLGGITNSIAVTVYAVDGRALGSGWVVSSLFSTAICGSIATSFVLTGFDGGSSTPALIGTIFYAFLAAWPGYYVVRSALAEAEPGELFDAEVVPDDTEDPIDALGVGATDVQTLGGVSFSF